MPRTPRFAAIARFALDLEASSRETISVTPVRLSPDLSAS
jgi:hypothetical protein